MITLKRYATTEGTRTALVKDGGHKYLHILMMEGGPLSVRKVALDEQKYMTDLGPLRPKHLKVFRSNGRIHGMTSTAKAFLREIAT